MLKYLLVSGSRLETSNFELQRTAKLQHALRSVSWLCRSVMGLAGPLSGRHFCGTPRFFVLLNLCFAWMPFEVGASRLQYLKSLVSILRLQAGEPPFRWDALAPEFVEELLLTRL